MVVQVHAVPALWPFILANSHSFGVALSSAGYFVFMPNPRGSYGQGEAFHPGQRERFGYGDFRDIMTGWTRR